MKIGPFQLTRTKASPPTLAPVHGSRGSWWPVIRESFAGAWQHNIEIRAEDALAYFAVYACTTLIAQDVAKCRLRLVEQDDDGIWTETESAAFSPVLRKPNRYQTRIKFFEQWIVSKLTHGNTYVLLERDGRNTVVAMYILDPTRVRPLVAPDGSVYYSLSGDNLAGLQEPLIVPASEILHDIQCALYHPLVGVSPIYACGISAIQGLAIQNSSYKFFANGSNPSGMLTAPGAISHEAADRLKAKFEGGGFSGDNVGKVVIAGDGLKYEQFTMTAVDSALIEQLRFSAETVCSCYHVLPYMIGIGPPPPYANVEPLLMAYYAQALQVQFESIEVVLDEGLGLAEKVSGRQLGTEFDINDLIWMDTATRTKAAGDSIGSASMSPDEARKKYLGLGPIAGGASAYMQQQNYSLEALAKRDSDDPFARRSTPALPALPVGTAPDAANELKTLVAAVDRVALEQELYAG